MVCVCGGGGGGCVKDKVPKAGFNTFLTFIMQIEIASRRLIPMCPGLETFHCTVEPRLSEPRLSG